MQNDDRHKIKDTKKPHFLRFFSVSAVPNVEQDPLSKIRRRIRTDNLSLIRPDIAELMRQRGRKVIPVPRTQHTHLSIHGQLHGAARHQPALFAFGMHDRLFAGARAGGVLFAEQAHLAAGDGGADEQQAQAVAAEVGLFVGAEDVLVFARRLVEGEEVGQGHRYAFEQLFQRADGGADAVLFDQRDGRIGHAAAPGELALGEFVAFAY